MYQIKKITAGNPIVSNNFVKTNMSIIHLFGKKKRAEHLLLLFDKHTSFYAQFQSNNARCHNSRHDSYGDCFRYFENVNQMSLYSQKKILQKILCTKNEVFICQIQQQRNFGYQKHFG